MWVVRLQAVEVVDGRAVSVRAEVKETWPNAEGSTLMGLIWAMTARLDTLLTSDGLQRG